ncbi:hypothetical protein [Eleftheria terrae]|uniref:hypothetical protein n=1 Tax=Eleftheria terrae TaxID=1597781 RepID=UPI00263AB6E6|nr:hypothetical protein [Eleftheria terrae]WKB52509.1 hypothetical protein N7L95_22360 [Eleftheria terrae]
MNITGKTDRAPAGLGVVVTLARLLERMERSPQAPSPEQYRDVVARLSRALSQLSPPAAVQAVLAAYPATAELYENLNYQHAGLCRSPLEAALNAELRAQEVMARVSRLARPAAPQ